MRLKGERGRETEGAASKKVIAAFSPGPKVRRSAPTSGKTTITRFYLIHPRVAISTYML